MSNLPLSKVVHDSAGDSGWYSRLIFHSLLWARDAPLPLTSEYFQIPAVSCEHSFVFYCWAKLSIYREAEGSAQYIHFYFLRRPMQSADHSGFLFLRKFQKWAANHSCRLQSVRTGSQRGKKKKKKEKSLPVNLVRLCKACAKTDAVSKKLIMKVRHTGRFF